MAWRRGAFAIPALERLEHGRDEAPGESDRDAVDALVLAVEVARGRVADVVLVAEREALVGPDGLLHADLPVRDLRGDRHRVAARLGLPRRAREAHRADEVARHLPVHHGVDARLLLHDREAAALLQLLDDLQRDLLVEVELARPVLEERHADALDGGVGGDALANEGIAASEEGRGDEHYGGHALVASRCQSRPHRSTTLTSRPGTTTTFTTC